MNKGIPTWLEKQKLLYTQGEAKSPEKLADIGQTCLKEGYIHEALEFFQHAHFDEGLKEIENMAISEGDAFLLRAMEGPDRGRPFSENTWNELGYKAMDLGKFSFARMAFQITENELMLKKLGGKESDTGDSSETR